MATVEELTDELQAAREQISALTRTVEDQAKTIAEITGAEPGAAPSVICLFWLYSPTRWHEKSWSKVRDRLMPFVTEHGRVPANEVTPLVWDAHRV